MTMWTRLLVVGVVMAVSLQTQAVQIGAGSGIPAGILDSAGSRLNIDNTVFPNLPAATYDVVDFEYSASANPGNLQPFLAALTGANQYTVLWVGPTASSPGAGINTVPYAPGTEQFTLGAATDVYAGFNASSNTVFFGAGLTDHNNPALFGITPGSVIGPFTNNNLGRSYAFEINVARAQNIIPEPATASLGLLALSGLAMRRRRTT